LGQKIGTFASVAFHNSHYCWWIEVRGATCTHPGMIRPWSPWLDLILHPFIS
jgi:hypothetical protein